MVLTVAIQKGGTGKTATATTLAQCLNDAGHKTLIIDTDTQGTAAIIYDADTSKKGIYEAIIDKENILNTVQKCVPGDIITPGRRLDRLQTTTSKSTTNTLKQALKPLKTVYEHIIIDTPPRRDFMLEDCLNASDGVIIPVEADTTGFNGFRNLFHTVRQIQQGSNKKLKVFAVCITRYNGRPTTLEKEYRETLEEYCKKFDLPAPHVIHNGVAIREAAALRCNLYEYKPKSRPATDYKKVLSDLNMI